jgi:cyanophycin synthetase
VIKPIGGNHGRGATIGIKTLEEAKVALAKAKEISRSVIVERTSPDLITAVGDQPQVSSAPPNAHRHVWSGDGKSTIEELVGSEQGPAPGLRARERAYTDHHRRRIPWKLLAAPDLTPASIPEKDDSVYLKATANLSTGGTAD